jgi:hypothetical protein
LVEVLLILGRQAVTGVVVDQLLKPHRLQGGSLEAALYLCARVGKVPVVDHSVVFKGFGRFRVSATRLGALSSGKVSRSGKGFVDLRVLRVWFFVFLSTVVSVSRFRVLHFSAIA